MIHATGNEMQAMQHNGGGRRACCAVVALMCAAAVADAQPTEVWPKRVLMANVSLGYQRWPALRDLDTQPLGTFDESGLNLAASAHVPWQKGTRSDLLLGLDLGLMDHESDVTAPGDVGDRYLPHAVAALVDPPVALAAHQPRSRRGRVSRRHAGVYPYRFRLRSRVPGTIDAWAPGGFAGISFDLPIGRTGRWSVNTGARVHYMDFGNVGALGADLGRLDGPITTLQLGVSYDWNGKKLD